MGRAFDELLAEITGQGGIGLHEDYAWWVGIDWATDAHQVCTIDRDCQVVDEREVEHAGLAIAQFVDWLSELTEGQIGRVAIAIETPRGAVVESLAERGFDVYAINPK